VCYYAGKSYKLHYACVACRVAFKQHPGLTEHRCPRCSKSMVCAGHDFAAPRRRDTKAWTVVAAVLNARLRYEGREPCGCGKEPKFRPRTRAQLRARRIAAARTGTPLAEMLGRPDPQIPA
jgi:DNA-directed RNA polymerase subunit RPC12/RpoP